MPRLLALFRPVAPAFVFAALESRPLLFFGFRCRENLLSSRECEGDGEEAGEDDGGGAHEELDAGELAAPEWEGIGPEALSRFELRIFSCCVTEQLCIEERKKQQQQQEVRRIEVEKKKKKEKCEES